MNAEVINFGCRLNIAEGEAVRAIAGDALVFNTCAVTSEAERQARQAIRRAARANPDRRIIVTGCGADVSRDTFAAMPEVSAVIGNADKRRAEAYLDRSSLPHLDSSAVHVERSRNTAMDSATPTGLSTTLDANGTSKPSSMPTAATTDFIPTDLFANPDMLVPVVSGADHARAFVEVQNGCDHRCTFCIIPFGRGNSRSAPAGLVIDAVRGAVERGHREVVLTGVDVTSYGDDLPGNPSLGLLVERILNAVPDLHRLRLSSVDSVEIDDRLFDHITGNQRVMPHVHLSLQAGDDMILKRMKRRHSRAEAVALVERLKARRPDIAIGADIIAGFPTEDDAMFANSLALIDDCDIVYGHIFPFSPRSGTPAARMPAVNGRTIRHRAAALRERATLRRAAWQQSLVGTTQSMLVERDGRTGHAENFARIALETPTEPGTIRRVRITGVTGDTLTAEEAA